MLTGFVPIALNTINGIRTVEQRYLEMARSIGASHFQLYAHVVLPFAMPSIVSGLRIGMGLTVIGVLVTEMLASVKGIGFLVTYYRELFETGHIYLAIIFALLTAVIINFALSRFERHFSTWKRAQDEEKEKAPTSTH